MRLIRLVALGAKLATAGGRSSWTRLAMMALGFAVGSGLLLAAMSVPPAMRARDDRLYGAAEYAARANATDVLLVWSADQRHGDEAVEVSVVEPVGRAPTPDGLAAIPGPGEMYISEALAERWRTPIGEALTRRLDATVVGTIAREGVEGPATLAIWVGKPTDVELPDETRSRSNPSSRSPLDRQSRRTSGLSLPWSASPVPCCFRSGCSSRRQHASRLPRERHASRPFASAAARRARSACSQRSRLGSLRQVER